MQVGVDDGSDPAAPIQELPIAFSCPDCLSEEELDQVEAALSHILISEDHCLNAYVLLDQWVFDQQNGYQERFKRESMENAEGVTTWSGPHPEHTPVVIELDDCFFEGNCTNGPPALLLAHEGIHAAEHIHTDPDEQLVRQLDDDCVSAS